MTNAHNHQIPYKAVDPHRRAPNRRPQRELSTPGALIVATHDADLNATVAYTYKVAIPTSRSQPIGHIAVGYVLQPLQSRGAAGATPSGGTVPCWVGAAVGYAAKSTS
jgi:hypothetical protein